MGTQVIELRFTGANLPRGDTTSKSDPFVTVQDSARSKMGSTETVINSHDPIFLDPVCVPERAFPLTLTVYDRDSENNERSDLLGACEVQLDEFRNGFLQRQLERKSKLLDATLSVFAEPYVRSPGALEFMVDLTIGLPCGHVLIDVYRESVSGDRWTRVYRSEATPKTYAKGFWSSNSTATIPVNMRRVALDRLDMGNPTRQLRLVVLSTATPPITNLQSMQNAPIGSVHGVFGLQRAQLLRDRSDYKFVRQGNSLEELGLAQPDYKWDPRPTCTLATTEVFILR